MAGMTTAPDTRGGPGRAASSMRAVGWMSASSVSYAFTYVTVRELSASFSVYEIAFFRAALAMLVMLPWLMHAGRGALRTRRWRLYVFRAVISYSGMLCWFYGLAKLNLADATAIMFTAPLLSLVFLSVAIKEHVGAARWAAILCGFAGALIIIRPGIAELSLAAAALAWTAVSYGASNAATRMLASTENANAVVFIMFATMVPLSLGPAAAHWITPAWTDLPMILAFAVLSLISMQTMTRSLAAAPASVGMPMFYLQLPFVAVLGFAFYGQTSDLWTWIGGTVICASGYFVILRESRAKAGHPSPTG